MNVRRRTLDFFANTGLFVGALLLIELVLQIASALFVDVDRITSLPWKRNGVVIPIVLKDDRLGLRGNPEWYEHDARGFRNRSAMSKATMVALGDSHTYGTNVSLEEAWPQVLSNRLGEEVYNMGLGSYGPTQNAENLSIALSLRPKLVIFAIYFGNDFAGDFLFAKRNGLLESYANADLLRRISELESRRTLEEEIGFLFHMGRDIEQIKREASKSLKFPWVIRKWLSDHSKLYGILRTAKNQFLSVSNNVDGLLARDFDRARDNITESQLPFVSVYGGPTWKTIFTSPYRFGTLDDADPRVRLGIEISKRQLSQMHRRVTEGGANYVVLLLPTKEFVFWPKVENPEKHKSLTELVINEGRIRNEIKRYMHERGIDFIDPIAALRESEKQPYFPDGDGHPNALGHRIIAAAVIEFIKGNKYLRVVSP